MDPTAQPTTTEEPTTTAPATNTAPNHIGINNNRKRNSYCYTNNHRTKNYSFWVSREYFWVMQENAPLVLW